MQVGRHNISIRPPVCYALRLHKVAGPRKRIGCATAFDCVDAGRPLSPRIRVVMHCPFSVEEAICFPSLPVGLIDSLTSVSFARQARLLFSLGSLIDLSSSFSLSLSYPRRIVIFLLFSLILHRDRYVWIHQRENNAPHSAPPPLPLKLYATRSTDVCRQRAPFVPQPGELSFFCVCLLAVR